MEQVLRPMQVNQEVSLSRLLQALMALLPNWRMPHRHIRTHASELSPHMARDIGLLDAMEKPSVSPEVLERSPRL